MFSMQAGSALGTGSGMSWDGLWGHRSTGTSVLLLFRVKLTALMVGVSDYIWL
jgi:hypothetical protein